MNTGDILSHILGCGTADLYLLNDIQYDVFEIIDELQEEGTLTLNNILSYVFELGKNELMAAFEEQKDDIRSKIEREIQGLKNDDCIDDVTDCVEYIVLTDNLELLTSGKIDPKNDVEYYINCLDTHAYLNHYDFYFEYMSDLMEQIEDNMGFCFANGGR